VTAAIEYSAGPQPGGRAPAPGRLSLVQAFVNTHYDLEHERGAEVLSSPRALAGWLSRRGLLDPDVELGRSELRRALDVREGIRAMLFANNGGPAPDADLIERLNRAAARPGLVIQLAADGSPSFEPFRGDFDSALAFLLALVARSRLEGSWQRLKACPGDDCGWAFYDYSRNQASAWCSMAICGSRAKARAYRERNRPVTLRR
jgi:predicted RNA-binding Zn ribbon-like protein